MTISITYPTTLTLPYTYIQVSGVSIVDQFAASAAGTMSLTVSCNAGTLKMTTASGGVIPGSYTKKITMTPTLVEGNFALSTLVYKCSPGVVSDIVTVTVWDQAGLNTSVTINIIAPTQQSPTTSATKANRTRTLSSMFAVNTHIDFGPQGFTPQYGDFTKLAASINYIWGKSGVLPLLRDWAGHSSDVTWWPTISNLTGGAKFIASIGETTPDQYQGYVDRALATNLVAYLDGPNEEDSASTNGLTNGVDAITSLNNAAAYMPQLYKIAQQRNLPLINMSYGQGWGTSYDPNFQHGYYGINGDLSAWCTYGNAHTYPQNGDPPIYNIPLLNDAAKMAAASRQVAITEFGYQIGSGGAAVSEDVQAKYGLMGLMDAFISGNVLYGWYGLYDDMSGAWGMFNVDYTPRMIATAFRNFFTVMADTGNNAASFTPTSLAYTLTGNCSQVLFQKSDGSFWLVMWNEQKLATNQSPKTNCILGLSATKKVEIFDPLLGPNAVQTISNTKNVSLAVTSYPMICSIK